MSTEMSIDFIHCNQCLDTNVEKKSFYLTFCSHIYCQTCAQNNQLNRCLGCGSTDCKIIGLDHKIGDDFKTCFKDTTLWMTDIMRAIVFQCKQRRHLIEALNDKIRRLETQNSELKNREKLLENENNCIKSENFKLKNNLIQRHNPFKIENTQNSRNTPIMERKPDLSRIFGFKNETPINRNQSLFRSNTPSMRGSTKPSNSVVVETPTDSRNTVKDIDSVRSRQTAHSSQLKQMRPQFNCFTPLSTSSRNNSIRTPILDTFRIRTPSTISTLSSLSYGVRPDKQKVVHKVTPFHR